MTCFEIAVELEKMGIKVDIATANTMNIRLKDHAAYNIYNSSSVQEVLDVLNAPTVSYTLKVAIYSKGDTALRNPIYVDREYFMYKSNFLRYARLIGYRGSLPNTIPGTVVQQVVAAADSEDDSYKRKAVKSLLNIN